MGKVAGFFKKVKNAVKKVAEKVVDVGKKVVEGVKTVATKVLNNPVVEKINEVGSKVLNGVSKVTSLIPGVGKAISIGTGIASKVMSVADKIGDKLEESQSNSTQKLSNTLQSAPTNTIQNGVQNLVDALKNNKVNVLNQYQGVPKNMLNPLSNVITQYNETQQNQQGIVQDINTAPTIKTNTVVNDAGRNYSTTFDSVADTINENKTIKSNTKGKKPYGKLVRQAKEKRRGNREPPRRGRPMNYPPMYSQQMPIYPPPMYQQQRGIPFQQRGFNQNNQTNQNIQTIYNSQTNQQPVVAQNIGANGTAYSYRNNTSSVAPSVGNFSSAYETW